MLTAKNITVRYGSHTVVDQLSFTLEEGQWLMLIGPNGAGKSTLLNAVVQGVPYSGLLRLKGRDLHDFKTAELARHMGVLTQQHAVSYGYTVEEIVNLGRYAHSRGFLAHQDDGGEALVEQALQLTGMDALRHASILTLSGGELQRAFLAQAFAQNPSILLLDEPANHLDLIYQQRVFSLIDQWRGQPGRAVISVVHDLSLARKYGSHALLLREGRCLAQGDMDAVFTREKLNSAYGMDVPAWMRDLLRPWQEEPYRFRPR